MILIPLRQLRASYIDLLDTRFGIFSERHSELITSGTAHQNETTLN